MIRTLQNARELLLSSFRMPMSSVCRSLSSAETIQKDKESSSEENATSMGTPTAEDVVNDKSPSKVQRLLVPYSKEALTKLKLDQYPLYVEREWWKTGKRMTFWATWRQLRDVKRREQVQSVGADRMRLKAIKANTILPQAIRDEAAEKLFTASKYDHPRLILNMCMFTGRQRGKIKPYRVNRHLFRKLADHSQLSGVQRAMW